MTMEKNDLDASRIEAFGRYSMAEIKPCRGNPRKHTNKQVSQIEASIVEYGFLNPPLIDEEGEIIAGHGRYLAAQRLGLEEIPVIVVRGLSLARKRALRIADNKLAENACWDEELLAFELQEISIEMPEFDLEITGFGTPELEMYLGGFGEPGEDPDPADEVPADDPDRPVVSQPGDLWLLGNHRLYCGDALALSSYEALMQGEVAGVVFVDPPYNVAIDGHVCGSGAIQHAEFAMASGEMSTEEFAAFLRTALGLLANYSRDGSIHYVCMDWRHIRDLLETGGEVYDEIKNLCVWSKTNAGMGSLYRSQHELVAVFKHGTAPHINNIELGKHGRNRTNIWSYPGVNIPTKKARELLAMHPTVKPVALVADAIRDCSKLGDIVLDSFAGSGTTLLAAHRTRRVARCMEIDPNYVDVAIRRFRDQVGIEAVHAETGLTFSEMPGQRAGAAAEETVNE